MNVVLDNNALIALLNPKASRDMKARLKGLLKSVEDSKGLVLIPTPVLIEYLSHTPERELRRKLIDGLRTSRWVAIAAFDEVAAEECAIMETSARLTGDKRAPLPPSAPYQSVKVDRQIVAIAKVRKALLVTGDDRALSVATWAKVRAMKVEALPIPESERQLQLVGVAPASTTESPPRARPRARAASAAPLSTEAGGDGA